MKLTRALDNTVAMFHSNIFAQSTKKTYGHYLASYRNFCIPLIPLTPINLGRYIAFLSSRLSFRSMQQYMAIVRLLHVEAGYRDPNQSHYILSLIKGAKRVLGDTAAPKLPITPDILKRIFTHLDFRNTRDITFWVAFFSFFRKSNLFVHSLVEFKPAQHLTRESVFPPTQYLGHSFRRGGATFALECGVAPDLIKSQGDWLAMPTKVTLTLLYP